METPVSTAAPADSRSGAITYGLLGVVLVVSAIFAISSGFYSNWYAIFRTVHVLVAVLWVGGGVLLTILGLSAQRKTDASELVTVARQAAFVGEKIFAPAGLVVLAMGIAMMINTDWGWSTFWIDAGLIGYASSFVVGVAVLSPLAKKVVASSEQNGAAHPETVALINRILLIARVDVAVLLLVVADMVTKPFS
jgi:uncharacterized membrane protein